MGIRDRNNGGWIVVPILAASEVEQDLLPRSGMLEMKRIRGEVEPFVAFDDALSQCPRGHGQVTGGVDDGELVRV